MERSQDGERTASTVTRTGGSGAPAPVLAWVRALAAMAQTGLTYARGPHDVGRYVRLRERARRARATRPTTSAFLASDALSPLALDRVTPAQLHRLSALAALPDAPTNFD